MEWAYGVTTVPSRRDELLPRTLASLKKAGFDRPHLFVDGCSDSRSWSDEFGLDVTARGKQVRTFGNWALSMGELYVLNPKAERYALFQDDFVTYVGLRAYLERCKYEPRTYWNLYTFPSNQSLCPKNHVGWYKSNQFGRGAVALVMDKETVMTLLSHMHMIQRPQDPKRGHRAVDGGIVTALTQAGWTEMVHNPSLVQHTGRYSSMGNKPHLEALSFRGESFNATELP